MKLRSGQRLGDMAAQQQDPRSPPDGSDASAPAPTALIQAPATPALAPQEQVQRLIDTSDPLNRRPQPAIPFLLERGYAVSNIADCAAAGPDGYFGCELFRVSALSGTVLAPLFLELAL